MTDQRDDSIDRLWEYVRQTLRRMGRPERLFSAAPARSALLVVDMQAAFCAVGGCLENPDTREAAGNINALVRAARGCGVPVIWLRFLLNRDTTDAGLWPLFQPASPWGRERGSPPEQLSAAGSEHGLWAGLEPDPVRDHEVVKCRYSPFAPGSSRLEPLLRGLGRDTLVVTGVGTNVCCETTARDAMMRDFRVVMVGDANATFHPAFHAMALMNVRLFFGDVVTTRDVLAEWEPIDAA